VTPGLVGAPSYGLSGAQAWHVETQRTLVRELQHRSNNLLAVIQAIAHRSLDGDHTVSQARNAFEALLQALSRANRQLIKSNWSGVDLREITRLGLEPFSGRVKIEGRSAVLGPQCPQNFSLALHELATNAAKYGALSTPQGMVYISWTATSEATNARLKFIWRERDGPPVQPPAEVALVLRW
jgi:two-component sensor histidine kinase